MDGDRSKGVDLERLRGGRLDRLQGAMCRHDVEACLLFNEPNIRYATGASAMRVWSNTTFVRCALVPGDGLPILFEHPNSMHLFGELEADVRPMHAWEFTDDVASHAAIFARETKAAMRELGVTDDRLAIDRLGTPGFLALQAAGISTLDSGSITMEAREVKTPQEIEALAIGGEVVMEMLHRFDLPSA
jgi:Xaa-Pro aminopeptidase